MKVYTVKCEWCEGHGQTYKRMNGVASDRRDAAAQTRTCGVWKGHGKNLTEFATPVNNGDVVSLLVDSKWQTWMMHTTDKTQDVFCGMTQSDDYQEAENLHYQTLGWLDGSIQDDER